MPELIPTKKFLNDVEKFRSNALMRKKIGQTLRQLEDNPFHPGLHLEKIVNDPTAWSIRMDRKYRLSLEPEKNLSSGNPDWTFKIILLRLLDHDDLYKYPH